MNELMTRVFENEEFGQVRTIVENGKVLFCGTDVARALGYSIPSKAVNTHCKGVSKMEAPTNGGVQKLLFITEGDVYRLIVHSRLDSAIRFEHWVFDEVLPILRKTGMYAMLPQDYPSALRALADSVEERLRLETKIEEDRSKVEFAEAVEVSEKSVHVGEVAKLIKQTGVNIGPARFFRRLRDDGYLMYRNGDNVPTQRSLEAGLMEIKETVLYLRGGVVQTKFTTFVTGKGQRYFVQKYGKKKTA